jgi:hypothetical protein
MTRIIGASFLAWRGWREWVREGWCTFCTPRPDPDGYTFPMPEIPIDPAIYEEEFNAEKMRLVDAYIEGDQSIPSSEILAVATQRATKRARARTQRGTDEPWRAIRRRIHERDGGHCGVCGLMVGPGEYDCGHIIDRMCGGSDRDDNLVTMCGHCNQAKPPHETLDEYRQWIVDRRAEMRSWAPWVSD